MEYHKVKTIGELPIANPGGWGIALLLQGL
jgi:hypothetical protein